MRRELGCLVEVDVEGVEIGVDRVDRRQGRRAGRGRQSEQAGERRSGKDVQHGRHKITGAFGVSRNVHWAAVAATSERVGMWASLKAAASSRRIGAVTLQSFSSGLPLGLVWIALPAFLTYRGVDIKTVGLFSLAQAPWSFKFLWSPLMDRYGPRFGRVGRRRSWILICQVFLMAVDPGARGGRADAADVGVDRGARALHRVRLGVPGHRDRRVRRRGARALGAGDRGRRAQRAGAIGGPRRGGPDDHGRASGSGGRRSSRSSRCCSCRSRSSCCWSPEPEAARAARRARCASAVFDPLIELFRRSGALPILGFLVLYKFGENLATALIRPFLIQKCYVARGRRASRRRRSA